MLLLTLLICFFASILITPLVKSLAIKIGATDQPNDRKVHTKVMPRLGGLAIYISFLLGILIYQPESPYTNSIIIGSIVIIITGILDDIFELSARVKLLGQLIAASIVIFYGGVQVEFINLPFSDNQLEFGYLSIPITFIWIVGITNAINLIDGLDGLAAGVSSIGLITISVMAILIPNPVVVVMGAILVASTLGFLIFNFHPAKIFMGDTGALFLGYMIAVLSLLGFKNVTIISLVIPVIILGVPISDTFYAIMRRILNKKPISTPDKSHVHHCLLGLGFTHRQTVVLIYALASFFGLVAVIVSQAKMAGSIILIIFLLILIELIAEKIGLVGKNYRPLLKLFHDIRLAAAKNR